MSKQKKTMPAVLITECSSCLGNALARKFVKAGYPTYASARRLESMEDLKIEGCYTLRVDVTDHSTIKEAVQIIEKEHQSVGILVNNAAIGIMTPIETISIDEVRKQYETNVFGLLAMSQAVLPAMRKAHKGRIVNIGSSGGEFTTPGGGVCQTTKYTFMHMPPVKEFTGFTKTMKWAIGNLVDFFGDVLAQETPKHADVYFQHQIVTLKSWHEQSNSNLSPDAFFSDGVHPSQLNYQLWGKSFGQWVIDQEILKEQH